MRLGLSVVLPCSNTNDGYDGWAIRVVAYVVITADIGIVLVVLIGFISDVIIVVFGIGKSQMIVESNRWRVKPRLIVAVCAELKHGVFIGRWKYGGDQDPHR